MRDLSELAPIQRALNGNLRSYSLPNGLQVAIEEVAINTISANINVHHSTADEGPDEAGFAHTVEHVIYFGSFRRKSAEFCDRVRQTIGWYLPFTEPDKASFTVGTMPSNTGTMLRYLASSIFEQGFPAPRLGKELGRIHREMSDDGNSYNRAIGDFEEALFKGHPYALDIFGNKSTLTRATPEALMHFHSRGYKADNMTLVVAGPVPKNIDDLVNRNFEGRPSSDVLKTPTPSLKPLEKKVEMYKPAPDLLDHENPQDSSAQIFLGLIAIPSNSRERIALSLLWHILYNYSTSRVFQRISSDEGLAYELGDAVDPFDMRGYLQMQVPVKSAAQERAIDLIFDEFQRLQEFPPRRREMTTAYRNLVYKTAYQLERGKHHVRMIERYLQTGLTPGQSLEILRSLAPEEVQDAARKFLPSSRKDGKYVLMVRDPFLDKAA